MTRPKDMLDTVVIGAGQAGLGVGYRLKQDKRRFVILERGRIGETWRSQRWDSFALNTPNWANTLPDSTRDRPDFDGFWTTDELLTTFREYAHRNDLPVRTGTAVTSVNSAPSSEGFLVHTDDSERSPITTRTVVVASGMMHSPKYPAVRSDMPDWIVERHSGTFRSSTNLPPGSVLVIGSGQSGCQITEDLLSQGRTVYLCTSRVGRLPRRYRSRDVLEWLKEMRFFDQTVDDLEDPIEQYATQPQISGVGRYGRTVSLQHLERGGARLLGRLKAIVGDEAVFADDLLENIRFADERSAFIKAAIDKYVETRGLDAPPREDDPADHPAGPDVGSLVPTRLDLRKEEIFSVVWCTGFDADFNWIDLPVLDHAGYPMHERGLSPAPGLFFVGFPWLQTRKSGLILGVEEDSKHIAEEISQHVASVHDQAPDRGK